MAERKKIVVVGLGMVGIAFIEKMLERDLLQKEYIMTVLGEETYLAYNRVGLTEYFSNRSIPSLFLNDADWYSRVDTNHMTYRVNEPVTQINREGKTVDTITQKGIPYDILVMATGSSAVLPTTLLPNGSTDGVQGVFVYRTLDDVQKIIAYSDDAASKGPKKRALVVGGGLLGLEAGKALYDLDSFEKIGLVHRSGWLLSQQLDEAGGSMLADKVRELGVDVKLNTEIAELHFNDEKQLEAVTFKDGTKEPCHLLVYAIGIKSRDEIARNAGLEVAQPRGGIVVDDFLRTSDPSIYAVGECASWNNKVFGLIAPGVEMADVVSFNLTQAKLHQLRKFEEPEVGTRLKLMGVDVASFGDYFADRFGPKKYPMPRCPKGATALTYHDPFAGIYKKLIFTKDGQYLLGGILVGNIGEFTKFSSMVMSKKKLDKPPTEYVVGVSGNAEDDAAELDDSAQVCSCNNVSKGALLEKIRQGDAKSVGELKAITKAGTACGGCEGTVKAIFNSEMKALGNEVSNALCIHFKQSRAELFHIIMVRQLDTFEKVMKEVSCLPSGPNGESGGCEICKPTIASILSSLYNHHVMDLKLRGLQETNDRFMGNIQRNGTYSVVPRVSAGEITPEKLIALGEVARKFNLYTKITGGQRIDLFGAQKQDLPEIWGELERVGFESGHAYGKSLRTVKSCVGTTWCRYGIGDSVGMALRLEERYKSLRSPHKFKGGVSGCVRDCAEFHNKDFGLCAVAKGFNVYVGGNGGMKPAHAQLLQADVLPDRVIPLLDRYIMFYIRTADRLQRTARWLENLPGGMDYLRDVIIDDKLGICGDLESQMNTIVNSFFDEWKEAVRNKELQKDFRQFANTPRNVETVEIVYERGQPRPADWPSEEQGSANVDFKNHQWLGPLEWKAVCNSSDLPAVAAGSSTTVLIGDTQIAIFRTADGELLSSQNMCPHKRAFVLSQGIMGFDAAGDTYISCPLHKRNFSLDGPSGKGSCLNDASKSVATFAVREQESRVYLHLPPTEELDALLGTQRWKVKKSETAPRLESVDRSFPMHLPARKRAPKSQSSSPSMATPPPPAISAMDW